jgi:hypothetical protein
MNRIFAVGSLIVIAFVTLCLAQTAQDGRPPGMFDLLRPGQFVLVSESNCGYHLRIFRPREVEEEIEAIRAQRGHASGSQPTPRESFESTYPKIRWILPDEVVFVHADTGRERHIARHAIVEVSRFTK